MPGRVPRKIRRFAIVSITAFAPFMWVKAFKTSCVRLASSRSARSKSLCVTAGCDVRTTTDRLSFAVFSDEEMMSRMTTCPLITIGSPSVEKFCNMPGKVASGNSFRLTTE